MFVFKLKTYLVLLIVVAYFLFQCFKFQILSIILVLCLCVNVNVPTRCPLRQEFQNGTINTLIHSIYARFVHVKTRVMQPTPYRA